MHFEYDIFLSYKTSDSTVKDWVNKLSEHVRIVLKQIFNKNIKIISAENITTISSDILMSTGSFVSIVTKEYLNDSIENSYLSEFNKLSSGKRIFKVIKETTENPADEPEILRQIVGHDFHHTEFEQNQKLDYDRFFKTEAERLYWLKVIDLAYDIYKATTSSDDEELVANAKKTVFIAEVSADQQKNYDIIKRELQALGYVVLPKAPLPQNKIDFENEVKNLINQSDLCIHIMGEKYGKLLDKEKISRVESQNKIASELIKSNSKIKRLIWLSPQIKTFEDQQNIYLEQLKKDIDELKGAELVQTPLEVFKSIIRSKLSAKNESSKKTKKSEGEGMSIYVINGEEDTKNIEPLEKWITNSGFNILKSDFNGDGAALVSRHRENLTKCDAALIYYAHKNPQWIKMKLQDLAKAPGFGREKDMKAMSVYTTVADDIVSDQFNLEDLIVIRQTSETLNESGLNDIAVKLKSNG